MRTVSLYLSDAQLEYLLWLKKELDCATLADTLRYSIDLAIVNNIEYLKYHSKKVQQ